MTDADRLRFAVTFATMPLDGLPPAEWTRLRQQIAKFLKSARPAKSSVMIGVAKPPRPAQYSPADFIELQAAVRGMLDQAADGCGPATLLGNERDLALYVNPATYQGSRLRPRQELRQRQLRVIGSVRASFLLTLALLLAGKHGHAVRRCPDRECGTLFFDAKKRFCSTGHRMRVYMRFERAGTVERYQRAYGR